MFCLGQLHLGTRKTNLAEIIAEGRPGAIKPFSGGGNCLSQLLAHADDLGALAGKQQCGFAHKCPRTRYESSSRGKHRFSRMERGQLRLTASSACFPHAWVVRADKAVRAPS